MSANQASIRAEIFERLDAYLDKSRREVRTRAAHPPPGIGTHRGGRIQFFHSRSNASADRPSRLTRSPTIHPTRAGNAQVERAVRARATHHRVRRGRPSRRCALARLDQTNTMPPREYMIKSHRSPRLTILPPPTDVPQDVAVRHILETELPPLPDPHTRASDDVNHRRENDGRKTTTTTTANDELRYVNDDDETEHMFLPTQAAIASTPGRRAMNNNGGGFDVYERGVDAIHAATARWSQSPPPYRHRDHHHHHRLHEEESEERLPRTRADSRQSTSPYSPAFAAGLRAASAPRARTTRGRDVSPSSGGRYHRDDADAAYVNRLRRNKSSSIDRTFSGRDSGYSSIGPSSTRRHHDASSERRPAWGGSGRVAPGSAERASHSAAALRRLADPEVASAKAER